MKARLPGERPRRPDRVGDLVRQVLSELFLRGLKDPRVAAGMVTITSVDVSPDLRHARIWVSALGDEAGRAAALAGLRSASGWLRRELGRNIRTKRTPELQFLPDPSLATANRIEGLIAELYASGHGPAEEEEEEEP